MFKFGKQLFSVLSGSKKILNDEMIGMIVIEIAMFQSWYEEKHNKMLPHDEIPKIAKKILLREDLIHTAEQIEDIEVGVSTSFPEGQIKKIRIETNFDIQVEGFCRSTNSEHLL
ncbi:hypothetical protein OAK06_03575 [Gammaproteobacteria bacterium]|nr:hypothetical protein [Gammaproteobacteria bacterium]